MPVFTAIATGVAALATGIGIGAATAAFIGGVAAFAARTLLTVGISKLISKRAGGGAGAGAVTGTQDAGARVQLPPATDNKLPVIYGSAYIAPIITDAKISTDQKTMWYVCALSEVTDTGTISFGEVYYDSKLVTFDAVDTTKVISLSTNSDPVQVDTKVDGKINMYFYNDGSNNPTNTALTAIQVLQDAGIDPASRWTSTDIMFKTAFVIVKVTYNQDAGTTNIGQVTVQLENTLTEPGEVLNDYMTNVRYGCAIPVSSIDAASLADLDTYSNQLITYAPVGGGTAQQPRYRINGPLNTGNNCLNNIQQLVDSCDSWLQYSELTGQWKVVVNKAYDQSPNSQLLANLYAVDSSVLIGGIEVNPIDLNGTYNSLEVQYPNSNIIDQTDFRVIDLIDPTSQWYNPSLLSPNEPANRLVIQYQQVNNYIQALYLGVRRLLQSREDLVINFALDYSGIQVEAGDVVRVTLAEYGWTDKLFRVSQVQEAKIEDGSLGVKITAFEYNSTVYVDDVLDDFVPEANTGLSDPNIIGEASVPIVAEFPLDNGNVKSFSVTSNVPLTGTTLYMDFNYGTDPEPGTHTLYKTVSKGDGSTFTPNDPVTIDVNDLPTGNYYWSVTPRNNSAGSAPSITSAVFAWPGPSITSYDPIANEGGVVFDQMAPAAAGFVQRISYDMRLYPPSAAGIPYVASTTTQRNIPLRYLGTAVSPGNYNTWQQGTWPYTWETTPTGLGTFNPPEAQSITGTPAQWESLGWYKVIGVDLSADTLTPDEWAVITGNLNFLTDVNNTFVQIVRYAAFSPDVYTAQMRTLTDISLPTAGEWNWGVTLADGTSGSSGEIYEFGYLFRNYSFAATVTCTSGSLSVKQNK